ncbi:MAG: hypothetical protein HY901_09940 [Deltaproteobacteria bacterium]|nr:hypothetical protein [Deltaproteobacteria bacterium]
MAELIDLGLVSEAKRVLEKLFDKHGIRWFMATEGPRLFALDKSKVDLVVRTALRARERRGLESYEDAIEHCRTQVRRDLIRRVAIAMLQTGC